jgi:hypothetical protein
LGVHDRILLKYFKTDRCGGDSRGHQRGGQLQGHCGKINGFKKVDQRLVVALLVIIAELYCVCCLCCIGTIKGNYLSGQLTGWVSNRIVLARSRSELRILSSAIGKEQVRQEPRFVVHSMQEVKQIFSRLLLLCISNAVDTFNRAQLLFDLCLPA